MATPSSNIAVLSQPWQHEAQTVIGSASATRLHLIRAGQVRFIWQQAPHTVNGPAIVWLPRGLSFRGQCLTPQVDRLTLHVRPAAWSPAQAADAELMALMMRLNRIASANGPVLACSPATLAALEQELLAIETIWHNPDSRYHRCGLKAGAIRALILLDQDPHLAEMAVDHDNTAALRAAARIEPALRFLEGSTNIGREDLTVRELAQICGYHPSRLHALFVQATGISPQRYLIERRIALACDELMNTTDPVLDISFRCGFASPSRFYQAFKDIMSTSPGRWRRSRGKDEIM